MQLNADDVRNIMKEIAENQGYQEILKPSDYSQYPVYRTIGFSQYSYTIEKLGEAGYLNIDPSFDGFVINDITWEGHQFIANTESPRIWQRTKETLKNIGSSSVPVMNQVASGLILAVDKGEITL